MLVEVWHDFSEVGFVEVPSYDTCSVRVFVDVAAELVVEFGQRWNVDGSNDEFSAFNPSEAHTWSSGQPLYGARGAVRGSVPCSRALQSQFLPAETRTCELQVTGPTL